MVQVEYPVINMAATGRRIRELRQARGITVRELSEYMGFTEPQAVYKWQRGDSLPTVDNLWALSIILGTTMEDILIGDDKVSSLFAQICSARDIASLLIHVHICFKSKVVNQWFIFMCIKMIIIKNMLQ